MTKNTTHSLFERENIKAEYTQLAAEIKRHDEAYFTQDTPLISDAEYDTLKRRLEALEEECPWLKPNDSFAPRVGASPAKGFKKIRHRVPMLSLGNAFEDHEDRKSVV